MTSSEHQCRARAARRSWPKGPDGAGPLSATRSSMAFARSCQTARHGSAGSGPACEPANATCGGCRRDRLLPAARHGAGLDPARRADRSERGQRVAHRSWRATVDRYRAQPGAVRGIAFLWFIGVIRDRVGDREDRFFATVFLGSGVLVRRDAVRRCRGRRRAVGRSGGSGGAHPLRRAMGSGATDHVHAAQRVRDQDGRGVHPVDDRDRCPHRHHPPVARPRRVRGCRDPPLPRHDLTMDEPRDARMGVRPQRVHPREEQHERRATPG